MTLLLSALVAPAVAAASLVWPPPQATSVQGIPLPVSRNFKFKVDLDSGVLTRASTRYEAYIATNATADAQALETCSIGAISPGERLTMNTSYRYTLVIGDQSCNIEADTVFGAIYGMESLYQLASNGTLPYSDINISDFPDFVHRGMMIDTGRRFFPVSLVKNIVDVMSFDKMNVLHLHASDMCRFGVESKLFPELTDTLAGIKVGHYTQEDIKDLVAYARDRVIRILPEFDMPGHAACFIPMEHRGLEWCNKPNESPIPNWCTLQAGNGTAAWELMPQLALEMAELFDSEIYHIGGDETRCSAAGSFEDMLLSMLAENGYRGMGWSEVHGLKRNDTIIHSWKQNATSIATEGYPAVDSRPNHFYRGGGKSCPCVTKAWSDLDKESVPEANRHLLLGGEFAFWTDAWTYISGCVRPGSGHGAGYELFAPTRDAEFALSAGAQLWPFGHLAAGSYWHFDSNLEESQVAAAAVYRQNTLAAWRGGLVCPTGCDCTITSICGEPLLPTPAPSPPVPKSICQWKSDTALAGEPIQTLQGVTSQEECCALCENNDDCEVAEFDMLKSECHLHNDFNSFWRNDGSLTCIPTTTTTTTTPLPTPTPAPPAGCNCEWHSDTGIYGNDIKHAVVGSSDDCCNLCTNTDGCVAVVFAPQDGNLCHVKRGTRSVSHPGSMACLPKTEMYQSII